MPLEEKAGDLSLLKINAEQSVMPSSTNLEAPVLELTVHKLTIGQEEAFRYMMLHRQHNGWQPVKYIGSETYSAAAAESGRRVMKPEGTLISGGILWIKGSSPKP